MEASGIDHSHHVSAGLSCSSHAANHRSGRKLLLATFFFYIKVSLCSPHGLQFSLHILADSWESSSHHCQASRLLISEKLFLCLLLYYPWAILACSGSILSNWDVNLRGSILGWVWIQPIFLSFCKILRVGTMGHLIHKIQIPTPGWLLWFKNWRKDKTDPYSASYMLHFWGRIVCWSPATRTTSSHSWGRTVYSQKLSMPFGLSVLLVTFTRSMVPGNKTLDLISKWNSPLPGSCYPVYYGLWLQSSHVGPEM